MSNDRIVLTKSSESASVLLRIRRVNLPDS